MLTVKDYPFRIFKYFDLDGNPQLTTMKTMPRVHRVSTTQWPLVVVGLLLGLLAPLMQGCQRERTPNNAVLMQIGDQIVTVAEYRRDLNIYRTATGAYPDEDLAADREMQIRFVRQMADQLVLLEHAHALSIEVNDRDLEIALAAIQRDYPDDVFEQLLLENAITLEEWKSSLRTRLIIERVIRQELEDHVRISEDDMAQFMSQMHRDRQDGETGRESEAVPTPSDKSIVNQLRRSKTEVAYAAWIADLKKKYPVEINQAVLNEVLSATTGSGNRDGDDGRPQP